MGDFMVVMNSEKKFELITRNLEEVMSQDLIKKILDERDLNVYWGTAPTGKIHIGYLIPFSKLADYLNADCEVTILIADIHAFLDNNKTPFELLDFRTKYYSEVIRETLKALGVDVKKLKFVKGSDFQLSKDYTLDVYKLSNIITVAEAKKAGAEVVKQMENPRMAPMLYPLLQALDEEHLKVDCQFGGLDQRKIFVLAHEYLPKLGYRQRAHLMNPMLPGLTGSKMSASDPASKIDLLDSAEEIKKKISKAYCPEAELKDNGVITFMKYAIFPYLERKGKTFDIKRPEKFGGNVSFKNYKELETAFLSKKLHPMDLKSGLTDVLVALLEPVRKHFEKKEMQELLKKAYGV